MFIILGVHVQGHDPDVTGAGPAADLVTANLAGDPGPARDPRNVQKAWKMAVPTSPALAIQRLRTCDQADCLPCITAWMTFRQ